MKIPKSQWHNLEEMPTKQKVKRSSKEERKTQPKPSHKAK